MTKAIDKHLGVARPVVETIPNRWAGKGDVLQRATQDVRAEAHITSSATAAAAAAEGWGTALKPAHEPIVVARKPLAGTVARNVLEFGTGALNIAGCRVNPGSHVPGGGGLLGGAASRHEGWQREAHLTGEATAAHDAGRWPANVLLTHSAACEVTGSQLVRGDSRSGQEKGQRRGGFADIGAASGGVKPNGSLHGDQVVPRYQCAPDCPVAELDRQSGVLTSGANPERRGSDKFRDAYGEFAGQEECVAHRGADSGGAGRFFPVFRYEAKAARLSAHALRTAPLTRP